MASLNPCNFQAVGFMSKASTAASKMAPTHDADIELPAARAICLSLKQESSSLGDPHFLA